MSLPSVSVVPSRPGKISVGIGSWTDKEYVGVIFPRGVKPEERLKLYAAKFDHVEVNAGYHVIQPRERVAGWAAQTPDGFTFDLKLPKAFAESPERAARDEALIARFRRSAEPLVAARKLGAYFLVLPTRFAPGPRPLDVLDPLIEKLRPELLAVELRHRGWIEGAERERTFEFFRTRQLVWIGVDMPRLEHPAVLPPLDEVTNPRLAYLRLHGRRPDWPALATTAERHHYEYRETELAEIAERVRALAAKAELVHVVANNHAQDFAPKAALALRQLLGRG